MIQNLKIYDIIKLLKGSRILNAQQNCRFYACKHNGKHLSLEYQFITHYPAEPKEGVKYFFLAGTYRNW